MFILDKPYASEFLIETITRNKYPVLQNYFTESLGDKLSNCFITEKEFLQLSQKSTPPTIYTSSENSIGWIDKYLKNKSLSKAIGLFKNKVKFRDLTADLFPYLAYRSISYSEIEQLNIEDIVLPFVIKPAVGFFSMGVHIVNKKEDWGSIKEKITKELQEVKDIYPKEVFNTNEFIIEELIEGEEFAFDAYFNNEGEPIILGLFKHYFASAEDVSDRVYYTSKQIVQDNYQPFHRFLKNIGEITDLRSFPLHVEMRKDNKGRYIPIEVNPMRFGGWCTTADTSYYAFGFNAYEYFMNSLQPNWNEILQKMDDSLFSLIVLDNSTGIEATRIKSFDYQRLESTFEGAIELRKVDYTEYPVFGFVITKTSPQNFSELDRIVHSDLSEFVSLKH